MVANSYRNFSTFKRDTVPFNLGISYGSQKAVENFFSGLKLEPVIGLHLDQRVLGREDNAPISSKSSPFCSITNNAWRLSRNSPRTIWMRTRLLPLGSGVCSSPLNLGPNCCLMPSAFFGTQPCLWSIRINATLLQRVKNHLRLC